MTRTFHSLFAARMTDFVAQKRILGYPYKSGKTILLSFDALCLERFPEANALTKDICSAWAIRRDKEHNAAFNNRLSVIREFSRYLIRIGEKAYVIPAAFVKKGARPTPHIYSEEEIASIWREFDNISPNNNFPARHFVLPAIVRLLYCCGLRPCEALRLKVDDVELYTGKLYVRESKGHKDRLVMLADDVLAYMREYNEHICRLIHGREWFFAITHDRPYSIWGLEKSFNRIRKKLNISCSGSNPPRLYDFRHTFATHSLYRWLKEGKDLTAMLPYLSEYMGHTEISATFYYIHLVPGQFRAMSGLDFSKYEDLLPEVELDA